MVFAESRRATPAWQSARGQDHKADAAKDALEFADLAAISPKVFPDPMAVQKGLRPLADGRVWISEFLWLHEPKDGGPAGTGWHRQLPQDPCMLQLWHIAKHARPVSREELRWRLGWGSVSECRSSGQQSLLWHVALGCAVSLFPEDFPAPPPWAHGAVGHRAILTSAHDIDRYLHAERVVYRSEDDCRSLARPTEGESVKWWEMKKHAQSEEHRFAVETRRIASLQEDLQREKQALDVATETKDKKKQAVQKELDLLVHLVPCRQLWGRVE